jgi:hypothetical protein
LFFQEQMQPIGPAFHILAGFDFNRHLRISQDQVDFRAAGCAPEAHGEIRPAVMAIRPALSRWKPLQIEETGKKPEYRWVSELRGRFL